MESSSKPKLSHDRKLQNIVSRIVTSKPEKIPWYRSCFEFGNIKLTFMDRVCMYIIIFGVFVLIWRYWNNQQYDKMIDAEIKKDSQNAHNQMEFIQNIVHHSDNQIHGIA